MGDKWYIPEEEKPELDESLLMHYGVKGMKWRRRKGRKTYGKKVYGRSKASAKSLYDEYGEWYENTKFGRLMNTPLTELFKNGYKEAEASSGEKYIWVKDPVTGLETKVNKKEYARQQGARRRQTNK